MNNSADDVLFKSVKATLEAVGNITAIISGTDINRDDWADSDISATPRIEYNPFRYSVGEGNTVNQGQFGITIIMDRSVGTTYGGGDTLENEGQLWALETEVIAALANVVPTGTTLVKFGPMELAARRRPTKTPDPAVGRRLNFNVIAYPGAIASTLPLSGQFAELEGLSSGLQVVNWNISVQGTAHQDFTTAIDTVPAVKMNRPLARVQIRAKVVASGTTFMPSYGSRSNITFHVVKGHPTLAPQSFTSEMLIQGSQWVPSVDRISAPQIVIINGIIDDSTSPIFDGGIP